MGTPTLMNSSRAALITFLEVMWASGIIDDVGPTAERINLDEEMTAINLAEVRMDLLEGPRSCLMRLKRLRWV
jgi:hypothetical protein